MTITPTGRAIALRHDSGAHSQADQYHQRGGRLARKRAAGGSPAVGTVSAGGVYTAPADLPSTPNVTITAVSQADAVAQGSVTVSLQNLPCPWSRR